MAVPEQDDLVPGRDWAGCSFTWWRQDVGHVDSEPTGDDLNAFGQIRQITVVDIAPDSDRRRPRRKLMQNLTISYITGM